MSRLRTVVARSKLLDVDVYVDSVTDPELVMFINQFIKSFKEFGLVVGNIVQVLFQKSFSGDEYGVVVSVLKDKLLEGFDDIKKYYSICKELTDSNNICVVFGLNYHDKHRAKDFHVDVWISQSKYLVNRYKNFSWFYTMDSFSQSSKFVNDTVHEFVLGKVAVANHKLKNFFGLGGESAFYALCSKFDNVVCVTDSIGVHENNTYNFGSSNSYLVDYCKLKVGEYLGKSNNWFLLVNISKKGLRDLSDQLVSLDSLEEIVYVGCDEAVVRKDMIKLVDSKKYGVLDMLKVSGGVTVVHLKKLIRQLAESDCKKAQHTEPVPMTDLVWNIFGSETSLDCDLLVLVKEKTKPHESSKLCAKFKEELTGKIETKKELNVNLGILGAEGTMAWVYKGSPDETNNGIIDTYMHHEKLQQHKCFIRERVKRDIGLKIIRALRIILSMFTRTDKRVVVKKALDTNTVGCRLAVLREIKVEEIKFKNPSDTLENIYKIVAFQIGQTLGLVLESKEFYSKVAIAKQYPELSMFLAREKEAMEVGNLKLLTKYLGVFVETVDKYILEHATFVNRKEELLL